MESHFTATGLVLNKDHTKALLIFHRKLQKWLPAGGHVESGEMPHETVIREVLEETGIHAHIIDASPFLDLSNKVELQIPAPAWVLHEPIPNHNNKPAHLHYDFMYILEAHKCDCTHSEKEVDSASWFTAAELEMLDTTEATRKMYLALLKK